MSLVSGADFDAEYEIVQLKSSMFIFLNIFLSVSFFWSFGLSLSLSLSVSVSVSVSLSLSAHNKLELKHPLLSTADERDKSSPCNGRRDLIPLPATADES